MTQTLNDNHIYLEDGDSYLDGVSHTYTSKKRKIHYALPSTTIYDSQVTEKAMGDNGEKAIEVIYGNPSGQANFTLEDTKNYLVNSFYITSLIHNIFPNYTEKNDVKTDLNIIGELVLKATPVSSGEEDLYVCLLLKTSLSDYENDIDKLISKVNTNNSSSEIKIPINTSGKFSKGAAVTYYSMGKKIIVFTNPILVNNNSQNTISNYTYDFSNEFHGTWDNIRDIEKTYILHSSQDLGETNNEIYIDCNPSGESAETIATYNVPINSEYTEQASKQKATQVALNLVFFIFIVVMVYTIIPSLYKFIVYEKFLSAIRLNDKPQNISVITYKAQNVRNIDVTLFLFIIGIFIYFLSNGNSGSITAIIYGIFVIGLSALIIVNKKTSDSDFRKHLDYDNETIKYQFSGFFPTNMVSFIKDFITIIIYPFFDTVNNRFNYSSTAFIVILLVPLWVLFNLGYHMSPSINDNILISLGIYGFIGLFSYLSGIPDLDAR